MGLPACICGGQKGPEVRGKFGVKKGGKGKMKVLRREEEIEGKQQVI